MLSVKSWTLDYLTRPIDSLFLYPLKLSTIRGIMTSLILYLLISTSQYAADFLRFSVGAREIGLAGQDYVNINSTIAGFWNPACLRPEGLSISLGTSSAFSNLVGYQSAGFALPLLENFNFGINWLRAGVTDIKIYPAIDPGDTNIPGAYGSFDYIQDAFLFSIKFRRYPVGATFKLIRQKMLDNRSQGLGLDLGFKNEWKSPLGFIQYALFVKDLGGTKINWKSGEKGEQASFYGAGAGYTPFKGEDFYLKLYSSITYDYELIAGLGIEVRLWKFLHFRGGLKDGTWAIGTGIDIPYIGFDYAFFSHPLGNTHSFSLLIESGFFRK